MAREKFREAKTASAKGKLTFVMFQLEGSDETLQEGFHAMEQAFDKLAPSARIVMQGKEKQEAQLQRPETESMNADNLESAITDDSEDLEPVDNASSTKPRRSRKLSSPRNLDIAFDDHSTSLKDFLSSYKNPITDFDRYVLLGVWFKDFAATPAISQDHIYSAFSALKWKSPTDLNQPFRDLTSKKNYFRKVEGKGFYAVTHIGEGAVQDMKIQQA